MLGQKQYVEAEGLLLAGYQGMQERKSRMSTLAKCNLTEAIERIVALYEAIDKEDEVLKWRSVLDSERKANKNEEPPPKP